MSQFAFIYKDEELDLFVAQSVEGIASQGKTQEKALENLKEALSLYYEDNEPLVKSEYMVTSFTLDAQLKSQKQNDEIRV